MFTPIHTSLGALLLFGGSFGLLVHNGRVFGISSFLRECLLRPSLKKEDALVVAGLVTSPLLLSAFAPSLLPSYPDSISASSWTSVLSTLALGWLIGWGTQVSLHDPN
jgi:hypothetical protein